MRNKYIIRNCPNLTTSYYGTGETIHNQCGLTDDDLCANCTDCLLKRIVEMCQTYKKVECCQLTEYARREVAMKILDILEIEECE